MGCQILLLSILAGALGILSLKNVTIPKPCTIEGGQIATSVISTSMGDVAWLVPIQIANKTFNVILDTGSADFWLFCTGGPRHVRSGHHLYDPKSGTKLNGSKFDITYGSGFAKGDVYTDRVTLGAITTTQILGCATSADKNDLGDYEMDGIMGLGFNSGSIKAYNGHPQAPSALKNAMNSITTKGGCVLGCSEYDRPNPQMTFMESAFPQLAMGLFTADLNYKQSGVYTFGYIDQQRFSTPITYMPVRDFNHWIVETSGYAVGNQSSKSTPWKVLIDTGTTYVVLPPAVTAEYFSAAPQAILQSTGEFIVPCDPATADLPALTLIFTPPCPEGNFVHPSSSGGVNMGPYNAVIPGKYFIGNPTGKNDGMCEAGIGNAISGEAFDVILGDVFMVSQLVIFDLGSPNGVVDSNYPTHGQIGFAPKPATNVTLKPAYNRTLRPITNITQ